MATFSHCNIKRACAPVAFLWLALFSVTESPATVVRFNFVVGGQSFGEANIRLYDSAMPNSVANFLGYVNQYDGTFIHRNTRNQAGGPGGGFVVQGGGFAFNTTDGLSQVETGPAIADEPGGGVQGISNTRGTLSNAKSGIDTVTSQWFVNLSDNSFLDSPLRPDGGFAAFGRVLGNGMDVFDAIDLLQKRDLDPPEPGQPNFNTLFDDVPIGDFFDPLNTLVVLQTVEILNLPDGDYNFDGTVDAQDYAVWRSTLGSTDQAAADGNGDGLVDVADYNLWRNNYGATASAPVAGNATPEPAAAVLTVGLLALLGSQRRRC